jgi:cysteine desulfurase / selenocysteine lyase
MIATPQPVKTFDVAAIRKQFPILGRMAKNNQPLVYLDNAATAQKPLVVIEALSNYYRHYNANIHRGIHTLAEEATAAYEATRDTVQQFINATHREEIIFTSGVTEGVNLVASAWGRKNIVAGDEIIISTLEHHSNIVPWQILCEEKGATLKVISINDKGEVLLESLDELITPRTKLISVAHVSNALGTINPVKDIIQKAHAAGALVFLDGAQSTVHLHIDVQELDCDFFAISSHKIYGPTGTGALYGKKAILEAMNPYKGGGEMIKEVSFEKTTYNELPYKFEAGTPNIGDTIALKAALDFITATGREAIFNHEEELLHYATEQLVTIPGLQLVGTAAKKTGVASFIVENVHPQDIGIMLDNYGIAVRTGHHCTQPLMKRLGLPGTVRASFAMYNTKEEIDILTGGLKKAVKMLQ